MNSLNFISVKIKFIEPDARFSILSYKFKQTLKVGAPETAYLTSGLIKEALNTLVRQSDAFYTQIWTNLTSNQKKALAGVVSENGGNLLSREISQITKMPTVTMQTALKSLTSQNILRQKEKEGLVHYIFEDPFFAHWIRFFTFLGQ